MFAATARGEFKGVACGVSRAGCGVTNKSIHHERTHRVLLELFAATEKAQLDEKRNLQDVSAKSLDQRCRGGSGATGGEQIVNQQHATARLERIDVDRHSGGPIFQLVFLFVSLIRKLALFTHGYESGLQFYGCCRCEDETTGIDPDDRIHAPRFQTVR